MTYTERQEIFYEHLAEMLWDHVTYNIPDLLCEDSKALLDGLERIAEDFDLFKHCPDLTSRAIDCAIELDEIIEARAKEC